MQQTFCLFYLPLERDGMIELQNTNSQKSKAVHLWTFKNLILHGEKVDLLLKLSHLQTIGLGEKPFYSIKKLDT